MDNFYLYAIIDGSNPALPDITGLDGTPITGVCCAELLAVVSLVEKRQALLTRPRLLQHEAVIEALMEQHTVLPACFGTLATLQQIATMLDRHKAAFAANLARVHGRVEIGLRVIWSAPPELPRTRRQEQDRVNGRSYMQALLAEAQQNRQQRMIAEALVEQLTVGLVELADEETHQLLPTPRLLLKAAFLVRREHVAELRRRVVALREAHPDLTLLATGPWPAYNFTGIERMPAPGIFV